MKTTLIDSMGSDLSVVNAARVSFGKQSEWEQHLEDHVSFHKVVNTLSEGDTKLIKYLAKHKHLSPFGHAFASFHVKAPIFVARQLVKHKFLRWNEISRRYVSDEPKFFIPKVWRGASEDKKQGSEGVVDLDGFDSFTLGDADTEGYTLGDEMLCALKDVQTVYEKLITVGVAPEQARMVLSANLYTEWYWSGSLDAFAAMCKLRCAPDSQVETKVIADGISEEMEKLFPVSWKELLK